MKCALARNFESCHVESMKGAVGGGDSSSKSKELVVFSIIRDSTCAECGEELGKGRFLFLEGGRPLCLRCADLDHLAYLPSGDAALTRRAKKHSALSAVVVRFSRARSRYERQGVLVEESALERAEAECFEDADHRAARQERDKERRSQQDRDHILRLTAAIRELFPGCPEREAHAVAEHTGARGSGRVGRTVAARALEEDALTAAVVAAIRHRHTSYDELLMDGSSRGDARDKVRDDVDRVLERWRTGALEPGSSGGTASRG